MLSAQYYLNTSIPLTLHTSGGGNLCPILTIVTPTQIKTYDLTTGVSLLSLGATVVSNTIYMMDFPADELGSYKYFWRVVDCTNPSNDITNDTICGVCNSGSFVIIKNPWDETLSDHLISGTTGYKLHSFEKWLLQLESNGTGECPFNIEVKGGINAVGYVYTMEGAIVAKASASPRGQYDGLLTFNLDSGTYRVKIIDSACQKKPVDQFITVSCGGNTSSCQTSF